MLKSLSTQFAATLFFGPIGLAYTSIATAVFLTLVLAVLMFSQFGVLSLFIIWPVSIIVGLVYVKLHNDQIRSSGSRLLLGPGEEPGFVSSMGSWARGMATLALILVGGYVVYLYLPKGPQLGRIVDATPTTVTPASVTLPESTGTRVAGTVVNNTSGTEDTTGNSAVIALPQREVTTVVIDSDGLVRQGDSLSALNSGQPELTVSASLVNLRRGPGTSFDIVTQLEEGEKLFEFARDGNWVNVETAASGYTGWIFNELVTGEVRRN